MKKQASILFEKEPLGMNLRNYLILVNNAFPAMMLAKDKVATKKLLNENGIATAQTIALIQTARDLRLLQYLPDEFVIKPGRGSGGAGILVLEKIENSFQDPSGEKYTVKKIIKHVRNILGGEFSGSFEEDVAMVEKRLFPLDMIVFDRAAGLPDIRIFCIKHLPVMAMMRYATGETRGRANLSAGAIGLAIDIESGKISHIHAKKEKTKITMDDLNISKDFVMPKWNEIKKIASQASKVSGLMISGIDVVLDRSDRVLVLEINGRPGIEIQNINEKSLLEDMLKL
jgi:alpha-L-glutamate ligase-like protein